MTFPELFVDDAPERVRTEIFGREVVADVIEPLWVPRSNGGTDLYRIDVDGRTYRVDASEATPV